MTTTTHQPEFNAFLRNRLRECIDELRHQYLEIDTAGRGALVSPDAEPKVLYSMADTVNAAVSREYEAVTIARIIGGEGYGWSIKGKLRGARLDELVQEWAELDGPTPDNAHVWLDFLENRENDNPAIHDVRTTYATLLRMYLSGDTFGAEGEPDDAPSPTPAPPARKARGSFFD